jgi:FkbM family methyltransferase
MLGNSANNKSKQGVTVWTVLLFLLFLIVSHFIINKLLLNQDNGNTPYVYYPGALGHSSDHQVTVDMTGKVNCGVLPCQFKSQSEEDVGMVRTLMEKVRQKDPQAVEFPYRGSEFVVLEAGGFDGFTYSNSYFFEHNLHWRAYHFEPSRRSFPQLQKNRPYATNVNAALCNEPSEVTFLESKEGLVSGIDQAMSAEFKKQWHTANDVKYTVPCVTLGTFLPLFGLDKIMIFFLDLEGNEFSALQGVNWTKTKFGYIVIEMDGSDQEREGKIKAFLAEKGYKYKGLFGDNRNGLFENENW